jgi:7-cyano-7-deazaguanine reductase
MPTFDDIKNDYNNLGIEFEMRSEDSIKTDSLLVFDYEYPESLAEVVIDTDEFTAMCPWTGLPDFGTLKIQYVPDKLALELKSLKYYLLSFSNVGMVQEHVVNKILKDLTSICLPINMNIHLDYNVRGGLHTSVTVNFEK